MSFKKVIAVFALLGIAKLSSGTLGIQIGNSQVITVGVDSRRHLHNPERYDDTVCKLVALDNRLLFFAVNETVGTNLNWNAQDEARASWKQGLNVIELGDAWAQRVISDLNADAAMNPQRFDGKQEDEVILIGLFALRTDTEILTARSTISYHATGLSFATKRLLGQFVTLGDADVASDFGRQYFRQNPNWVMGVEYQAWKKSTDTELSRLSPSEKFPALIQELGAVTTELTADAHPIGSPVHGHTISQK